MKLFVKAALIAAIVGAVCAAYWIVQFHEVLGRMS